MTQDEARKLLDEMLYPFSREEKCLEANKTLSSAEISLLLQIVIDFENLSENFDYENALKQIATILGRYVKGADTETDNGTKIAICPDAVPFLIKQVLFFIAVSCIVYKIPCTQKDIVEKLNGLGVQISHNFFSRMHTTPSQYVAMKSYKQPELPIKYKGQKHKHLAVAINNLAYQAGKYDVFCDIFGGSGAATLAVSRRKDAEYVYNELHRTVYNLFRVLTDAKMHKDLITELELLQKDLRGEGVWLDEGYDFDKEVQNYFNSRKHTNNREKKIIVDGSKDLQLDYNDIVNVMQDFRQVVINEPNDFQFSFEGVSYKKQQLLNDIFPDRLSDPSHRAGYRSFMSFMYNYRLIEAYAAENRGQYTLMTLTGTYLSSITNMFEKENIYDSEDRHKQLRFYMYYAYFSNLLNKGGVISSADMVRYAVAEIYRQTFITNGSADVSAIVRMNFGSGGASAKSTEPKQFLDKDFRAIITNIYNIAKDTICERLDCIDVIDKYRHDSQMVDIKHNVPLFYSDSPYEGTSGYKDEINGIAEFTTTKMKDLILALKNSGDKFIFSCRAVKGAVNGSNTTAKLKETNLDIFAYVFEHFLAEFYEKGKDLWVLAIEEDGKTLSDLIKKNEIAEIMITNYEIHSFKEQDTVYKVYTFEELLKILIKNANV